MRIFDKNAIISLSIKLKIMNDLPCDILFRIIGFDVSSCPQIYKLNKAMHEASYSDPNFNQLIYAKFNELVKYNAENTIMRTLSLQMSAITIATCMIEVREIINCAIGHPQFSLNNYVNILLQFGAAMNLQIAQLQKNLSLAVVQIESLQTSSELDENHFHELISIWYQLQDRVHCMLQRLNFWLKLQNIMQIKIDAISYNATQWQCKMEWILTRDTELRAAFNGLITSLPDASVINIISFFRQNADQQNLFEQSFVRWTADHIKQKDYVFQMMTILELTSLANDFHESFERMKKVCIQMQQMTVSVLDHDVNIN